MSKSRKPSYTYSIEPGQAPGTWQWEIRAPDGSTWAYGARRGTKRETASMIKKTIRRITGCVPAAYHNMNPEQADASRRRGQLANRRITL